MWARGLVVMLMAACAAGCVKAVQVPRERLEHPGGLLFNGYVKPKVDCWRCHNGHGRGAMGPSLVVRAPALSNSRMRKVILGGFGLMPGFRKHLTDEEVEQLIAWQRAAFPQVNHQLVGSEAAPASP